MSKHALNKTGYSDKTIIKNMTRDLYIRLSKFKDYINRIHEYRLYLMILKGEYNKAQYDILSNVIIDYKIIINNDISNKFGQGNIYNEERLIEYVNKDYLARINLIYEYKTHLQEELRNTSGKSRYNKGMKDIYQLLIKDLNNIVDINNDANRIAVG